MSEPDGPQASSLLDYYHCTFFLPLSGFGAGLEPHEALRQTYPHDRGLTGEDAQAFYYFTPTLRDIVFDRGDIPLAEDRQRLKGVAAVDGDRLVPVREWRLDKQVSLAEWRLVLEPSPSQKKGIRETPEKKPLFHQEAVFTSVRLYRYFNGIYLLAFTVKPKALADLEKAENISLFGDSEERLVPRCWADVEPDDPHRLSYADLQLESWLRFTRLARQLYPSFTEQGEENKIAPLKLVTPEQTITALDAVVPLQLPQVAAHLSPIIVHLVQQFFVEPTEDRLKQQLRLFDDRLFVSVAYGLAGKPYDDLHRVRALLATTDRFDDTWADMAGYAYSRMAVERYLQNTEFDFWADMGGHYIFNDMVNAYLYNGWFFRNVIAPKHIPYMYDRMLLQVLFYQASLRHYDHAITRNTTALLEKPHPSPTHPAATNAGISKIRKQRADFIRFTNQYWFREVSNQMQGKMIFRLQYQGLGIDAYYQQLEGEIVRTNEYLQVLHENRLAEEAGKAGKQANKLAGIAAALALIAALPVVNEVFKNEGLWGKLASRGAEYFGISLFSAQSLMAGLLVAVPGLVAWLFWRGKN